MPEAQTYPCPTCGTPLKVKAAPGMAVKCPKCGKKFHAPATDDTLQTPQPSPPTATDDQPQPDAIADTLLAPSVGRTVSSPDVPAVGRSVRSPDVGRTDSSPHVPGYEILDELGRGGMGVVYKARHIGLNRIVALKMILSAEHAGKEAIARFKAEAEAVAQLKHPNIIQVYDIGEQDGRPFFSMELVEGGSLSQRIGGQPQPPKWCAEIAEKLALAMHVAHSQGIVHRDLKPANVLLTVPQSSGLRPDVARPSGSRRNPEDCATEPKIMDFGLAKRVEGAAGASPAVPEALTQSGAIMGTPQYMAPEQASGEARRVGPPADVYALGAILYTMLTGKPPFSADTAMGVLRKVLNDEPTPPTTMHKRIPPDLETICLKCLQKEPQKRYASAHELAADLRRYLSGEPIVARPSGSLERAAKWAKRRPAAAMLIGVSAVALVALVGGGVWYNAQLVAALGTAKQNEETARKNEAKATVETAEKEKQRKRAEEALLVADRNNYSNVIALADRRIKDGQFRQAQDLLAGVASSNDRGWEWGHLLVLCNTSLLTLKHTDNYVRSVAFSPDGKRLATASPTTATLWDADTGREVRVLRGDTSWVSSVAFSPDGKRLAIGGEDKKGQDVDVMVGIWDTETGRKLLVLKGHTRRVTSVAFSPDGKRLATGGYDRTAKVWDAETGRELLVLKGHSGWVSSVAFSPDGKRLATGGDDRTAKVWDAETGRELLTLKGYLAGVLSVAFSPDGKRLATGSVDKKAKVWDAETGHEVLTLTGYTNTVNSVAFSPDGRRLATGGGDMMAKVWDAETGHELLTLKGHAGGVYSVAFSPDGKRLATASNDGTAKVWDAETNREVLKLTGHADSVSSVGFSPDGKRLATGSEDKTAKIWDAETGREVLTLGEHTEEVGSVTFSRDGKRLVTGPGSVPAKGMLARP